MKKKIYTAALTAVLTLGIVTPSFKTFAPGGNISVCSIGHELYAEF